MADEVWKDVADYVGHYQVSDMGRVRSVTRVVHFRDGRTRTYLGVLLRPRKGGGGTGYLNVSLTKNDEKQSCYVHHLVAAVFLPPRPEGTEINHIKNSLDNRAVNLEWVTHQQNAIHAIVTGQRDLTKGRKLTDADVAEIRRRGEFREPWKVTAAEFGISAKYVGQLRRMGARV